jgi:hypothetical protein
MGKSNYDKIFGEDNIQSQENKQPNSFTPEKKSRLEELRRKKAEGTLGR